jgi:mannitol-1-phosphate/altronate dehydrogenase
MKLNILPPTSFRRLAVKVFVLNAAASAGFVAGCLAGLAIVGHVIEKREDAKKTETE